MIFLKYYLSLRKIITVLFYLIVNFIKKIVLLQTDLSATQYSTVLVIPYNKKST